MNALNERFRKPLSLKTAIGYNNIIWGISLILSAASYSFSNVIVRVLVSAFSVFMTVVVLATFLHKKDAADEMYLKHIGRASYNALNFTILLLVLLSFLSPILQLKFSMEQVLYFAAGIGSILQGIFFIQYESHVYEEDEEC
ncbi:MAG: hypothetical protein J6O61_02295 [Butyrivibrio sp.]|uniref:hypothetical protein n=1 Tax=Butyrivibrio sp. TaxID=28121 RepID=UPI001B0AE8F5|nr:hypothetical protein [Butyrivibrio sp.]MBO6239664.1 hypothetical protein [Butyrivibrio sp.]